MSTLSQALIFVVQTLGSLYVLVVLLRFILQLVRADFYNPLSQFTVRATQPLLMPLRRVIPGVGGVDLASVVLALLVQLALMCVIALIAGYNPLADAAMLPLWALITLSSLFLKVFFFALILSVILSWIAPQSHNPGALLAQQICAPLLAPIQRILPNLGGLDLSPIFAFIALNLLDNFVIKAIAVESGMPLIYAFLM